MPGFLACSKDGDSDAFRQVAPHKKREGGISYREWRRVPGADWYRVSKDGRVRSVDKTVPCGSGKRFHAGRDIVPIKVTAGYLSVGITYNDGKRRRKSIHSLVAEAFIGPRPKGAQVAHGDGNPLNNHISNLRYATRSENAEDRIRHGRCNCRTGGPIPKLKRAQVLEIVQRLVNGESYRDLAEQFSVKASTIAAIKNGRSWRKVTGGALNVPERPRPAKICLNELRRMASEGITQTEAARHFDCKPPAIANAIRRHGIKWTGGRHSGEAG